MNPLYYLALLDLTMNKTQNWCFKCKTFDCTCSKSATTVPSTPTKTRVPPRLDTSLLEAETDAREAGFKNGDKVTVVLTSDYVALETRVENQRQELDRLTKDVRDQEVELRRLTAELNKRNIQDGDLIRNLEAELTSSETLRKHQAETIRMFQNNSAVKALESAQTVYVLRYSDGTLVRRGRKNPVVYVNLGVARNKAQGCTVVEAKLVVGDPVPCRHCNK